jgi:hypothetical protein
LRVIIEFIKPENNSERELPIMCEGAKLLKYIRGTLVGG